MAGDRRVIQPGQPGHLREYDDRARHRDEHRQAAERPSGVAQRPTSIWRTVSRCRNWHPRVCWQSFLKPEREGPVPGVRLERDAVSRARRLALPFDTDARALFYNKDMIEAVGRGTLLTRYRQRLRRPSPRSWLDRGQDHEGRTRAAITRTMGWIPGGPGPGGQPGAIDQGWHYTWGFAHGGKFADTATCKVTPTDPGVVAGFQFLSDFAKAARSGSRSPRFVRHEHAGSLPTLPSRTRSGTGKLGDDPSPATGESMSLAKYSPDTTSASPTSRSPTRAMKAPTWAGGWSGGAHPRLQGAGAVLEKFMQYFAGPEGQKVYTKENEAPTYAQRAPHRRVVVRRAAQDLPRLH